MLRDMCIVNTNLPLTFSDLQLLLYLGKLSDCSTIVDCKHTQYGELLLCTGVLESQNKG